MWKCHKCGKPVYFAERKQSLGYDWHPECLRCEECGKRLDPGRHAEHKGVPYCHIPCYAALFGPQLFGHGTRVESHKSFGQQRESPKMGNGPFLPQAQIEAKLKIYNQYYDGKSGEIRSRKVNGRLVLEGSLRIHWGVQGVIHLKENDDQRTVVTVRKRNSCRISYDADSDEEISSSSSYADTSACSSDLMTSSTDTLSPDDRTDTGIESGTDISTDGTDFADGVPKSLTLPPKLDIKSMEWDELDELLQVERKLDGCDKLYQTMPTPLPSQSSVDSTNSTCSNDSSSATEVADCITNSTERNGLLTSESSCITESNTLKNEVTTTGATSIGLLSTSMSSPDCLGRMRNRSASPPERCESTTDVSSSCYDNSTSEEVEIRRPAKTGSTAIKRRPGKRLSRSKIKRRCSINGHFYDRETSFFTPPHGSQMSVWISSLVNTQEVINLMLEKYKVDSDCNNFALFVVRDNGEQRKLKEDEYPLLCRVMLGPHEDVSRLFLMDSNTTSEVSNEVAQFLNFTLVECRAILNQYHTEEDREVRKIKEKYIEMKRRIKQRMEDLKVRL